MLKYSNENNEISSDYEIIPENDLKLESFENDFLLKKTLVLVNFGVDISR